MSAPTPPGAIGSRSSVLSASSDLPASPVPASEPPDDRGTVTAETAVLLPALALVLLLAVWAVNVVALQVRCADAAGSAARALARGETAAAVRADLRRVAPRGAQVDFGRDGRLVVVEVRLQARLPGPWGGAGPGVPVRSRAVAMDEQQATGGALDDPEGDLGGAVP